MATLEPLDSGSSCQSYLVYEAGKDHTQCCKLEGPNPVVAEQWAAKELNRSSKS